MREILFRGKLIDNDEWVYGNITQHHYDICNKDDIRYGEKERYFMSSFEINDNAMVGFDGLEIIPETVGQYTGLCDKNGTKIFEGDIIKDCVGIISVIEWAEDGRFLGFAINKRPAWNMKGRVITYIAKEPAVEVIGNIHDNPEMLEV